MKKLAKMVLAFVLGSFPAKAQNIPASFADLAEALLPSVVNISTTHAPEAEASEEDSLGIESENPKIREFFSPKNPQQVSLGSGFIIDESGLILTNNHVIDGAREITVTLADEDSFAAEIVGKDDKTDLALIKIDAGKKLPSVRLGDSDRVRVGDWILAIGNPFGLGGSVTAGIVSAKSRDIEAGAYDNFIQTDASINQGSSGGPMFNMAGEVIGINTAIFSTSGGSMGIGFAVPVNLSKFVIAQLKEKGKVERSWLGIKIQPNTTDISLSLQQTEASGILVTSVDENSNAKQAGIEAGDIIVRLNGKRIDDPKDFSRQVAETEIGGRIELDVWKDRKLQKISLKTQMMPAVPSADITANISASAPVADNKAPGYIKELKITLEELSPTVLDRHNLPRESRGVVVSGVDAGSDAEQKGLKRGDLITEIDKKTIFDLNDVKTYVEDAKLENNRPVLLLINNNNIPHYAAVKLTDDE